jgi:hypothetical protein
MLHISPKSFLKSSSCLGDPWTDRWFGSRGVRLGLLFPCLANCPRVAGGLSARCSSFRCSSCSSQVLEHFCFNSFFQLFLVGRSLADCPPQHPGPSARHQLLADCPRIGRGPSFIGGALLEVQLSFLDCPSVTRGPSACTTRTIRPVTADCPPGASQSC